MSGNGNGHQNRRAEDAERRGVMDEAWAVFAEAVKTHPTRGAFDLALMEFEYGLRVMAVRRLGHSALKPLTISGSQR